MMRAQMHSANAQCGTTAKRANQGQHVFLPFYRTLLSGLNRLYPSGSVFEFGLYCKANIYVKMNIYAGVRDMRDRLYLAP
jgi:hypothetical protein